jgi:urea ABC transporter permease protein UrtB
MAFLSAAAVGALMERSVLRHLYGRPLETLLATWGISLILMQTVRTVFGAQNVAVENPTWMSGGIQVLVNLSLPWNRVLIVLFALLVLAGVALLISQTRLGLFVRGVTQNRAMASCMGVNTARIDTYAFALGSGIAGLAGCALSQIGNVGPDLGQGYIVDAFMVVVLGGVGQLAGTVYAALGLGVLNKFLEGWTGAVLAKIAVLVFIIIFIQKRPQGLFAMKGRSAEARDATYHTATRTTLVVTLGMGGVWGCAVHHRFTHTCAQPLVADNASFAYERFHRGVGGQDHVLCDLRLGHGFDLGLHRYFVIGTWFVFRAGCLCHGHVPDAANRHRRQLQIRVTRFHGVSRLESAALALVFQRQFHRYAVVGGAGTGFAGFGVRLLCFPFTHQRGVFLHHHASHDIRIHAAVFSQ